MSIPKPNHEQNFTLVESALVALLVLTLIMLLSLFTSTQPHPPLEVIPFSLAPFLGSTIAVGLVSLLLIHRQHKHAWVLTFLFSVLCLVSFGPQKYLDPAFSRIWPAIICAQLSLFTIAIQYFLIRRRAGDSEIS